MFLILNFHPSDPFDDFYTWIKNLILHKRNKKKKTHFFLSHFVLKTCQLYLPRFQLLPFCTVMSSVVAPEKPTSNTMGPKEVGTHLRHTGLLLCKGLNLWNDCICSLICVTHYIVLNYIVLKISIIQIWCFFKEWQKW